MESRFLEFDRLIQNSIAVLLTNVSEQTNGISETITAALIARTPIIATDEVMKIFPFLIEVSHFLFNSHALVGPKE